MRSTTRPKVLIVDDDASVCEVFKYFLSGKGCEVFWVEDGHSGREAFLTGQPDVVLLDLRIPGPDGLDLLAEFSRHAPNTPIIVVTASDDVRDTVQSLRLGAFDFVFKPVVELDMLWHAVRKALDRASLLRENQRHRENLESLVVERTAMLERRTLELEQANAIMREEIAERKRTELALKSSEERFRSLIETVGTIIVVISPDEKIIEFNREAELIGYSRLQAIGRNYLELLLPEKDWPKARALIQRALAGESIRNFEMTASTRTAEEVVLSWNIERLFDEWGNPVAVVASGIDVTQSKRLEKMREEVQRVARHDLKTPLVGIDGFVRLLLKEADLPEKAREYLNYIRASAEQMTSLIDNTLDLVRMEQATYVPCKAAIDFRGLLQLISLELEPLLSLKDVRLIKSIGGEAHCDGGACVCLGEEGHIKTMFRNLIKNAVEAAPQSSQVTIKVNLGENFEVDIHNQGEIPAQVRDKFFERYTTCGKPGGTGLGTYSAMLIARSHGGRISFTSSKQAGTHLLVRLPAAPLLPAKLS